MINLTLLYEALPYLWHGTIVTIKIAYFSCILGIVIGTILALMQTSKIALLVWPVKIYVTIMRGTPMIIQIFFMYFGIFNVLFPQMPAIYAAIFAIGMNSSAYVSQIIRAGINSVSTGQLEAAQVMGLSRLQTIRHIILPQAMQVAMPALGNEFATLIKDSSLASFIGVSELFKEGRTIIAITFDQMSIFIALGLIYLILTSVASIFVSFTERRMSCHVKD
ncbi:MAG TPA: amino acid ABC transporter permease [Candidatus Babeliales bacterium]|nr:amino acid ABC transporter permease [Candidatus Babeliales bacterium]